MLTEKRPREILADFKKILDILNFTPVLILFPVLSGVSTFKYLT